MDEQNKHPDMPDPLDFTPKPIQPVSYQTPAVVPAPKKRASPLFIILAAIIVSPLLLAVMANIGSRAEDTRYKNEIRRVESLTGIKASSVECNNIELAEICSAQYDSLGYKQAKDMLISSGYVFESSTSSEFTRAKNANEQTSVTVVVGEQSKPTVVEYKNINVTL